MLRVYLDYALHHADTGETEHPGVALDTFYPALAMADRLLERFLGLGTPDDTVAAYQELTDDTKQKPVPLERGTLAELLQVGIPPVEAWTFVLNHGGARSTTTLIFDPGDPKSGTIRRHDVSLKPDVQRRRIQRAIDSCRRAAKALLKVQSMDMTEPLAARGTCEGSSWSIRLTLYSRSKQSRFDPPRRRDLVRTLP